MHPLPRPTCLPALVLLAGLGLGSCADEAVPPTSAAPQGSGSARPSGKAPPSNAPGPTRYEISSEGRLLGVATRGADGSIQFEVDPGLPSPCYADDFEKKWAAYPRPETVHLETGGVAPDGTRFHGARAVKRGTDLYPYALLSAFLGDDFHTEPALPRSLDPEDRGSARTPSRFEVSAFPSRGEAPANFTGLPVGVFTVGPDGAVSLETTCEGEYLAARLATHFAKDEIELAFAETSGHSTSLEPGEPGNLRLGTPEHADIEIRYRRGGPEFFAALMTMVDHRFDVSLDVEPAPRLAASTGLSDEG